MPERAELRYRIVGYELEGEKQTVILDLGARDPPRDLLDPHPNTHYPILVAAKGACPPEDCGGSWSYIDLKAILANPSDEQHQEMREWLGVGNASEFDPTPSPTTPSTTNSH